MAQAVSRWPLYRGGPVPVPGQSIQNLCLGKWHQERFSSKSIGFPWECDSTNAPYSYINIAIQSCQVTVSLNNVLAYPRRTCKTWFPSVEIRWCSLMYWEKTKANAQAYFSFEHFCCSFCSPLSQQVTVDDA